MPVVPEEEGREDMGLTKALRNTEAQGLVSVPPQWVRLLRDHCGVKRELTTWYGASRVEGVKAAVFPAEKQGKEAGYGNLMGDMNRGMRGAVFAAVRGWLGTWKKSADRDAQDAQLQHRGGHTGTIVSAGTVPRRRQRRHGLHHGSLVAKHAGMDEIREKVLAGGGHVLAAFPQGALVFKEAWGPLDREYGSGGQEWRRVVRPMKRDPSGEEAILIRVGAPRKK